MEMRGSDGTSKTIPSIFLPGVYAQKMKECMSRIYSGLIALE